MGFFAFFFSDASVNATSGFHVRYDAFVCLFVFFFFFWCAKNDEVGFVLSSITFSFLPCTGDFFFYFVVLFFDSFFEFFLKKKIQIFIVLIA